MLGGFLAPLGGKLLSHIVLQKLDQPITLFSTTCIHIIDIQPIKQEMFAVEYIWFSMYVLWHSIVCDHINLGRYVLQKRQKVAQGSLTEYVGIFYPKWAPEHMKKPADDFFWKSIPVYKADIRSSMEENLVHSLVLVGIATVTQWGV